MVTTRGRGRPSKLTVETKEKLLKAIRSGSYYEPACDYAGISYNTFRDWMRRGEGISDRASSKEYVDFVKEVKAAVAEGEITCIAVLRASSKTDPNSAKWLLERRHPDRWANAQRVKVELAKEIDKTLDKLESRLSPEIFEQVLIAIADGDESEDATS